MASADSHLNELLDYCAARDLFVSSALQPQYADNSGLGLHTVSAIKKGTKILHAPVATLLTTASIPQRFLPDKQLRADLTVHGLLASWLAFGDESDLADRYEPWMRVWPPWDTFRDTMPVFWELESSLLLKPVETSFNHSSTERGKVSSEGGRDIRTARLDSSSKTTFSLSPAIDGFHFPDKTYLPKLLREQIEKVRKILMTLHDIREILGFDILSDDSYEKQIKFLHMWSCVNTRCFYYLPTGVKAPKDPNEAMALVPFLDLFNHSTAGQGADVKYDKTGFAVFADRDYLKGEEIFIQYGAHSTDALWIEYGFIPDENAHDELCIDQIVLSSVSDDSRKALKEVRYLGEYTISQTETGYRTEVVAWLLSGALSHQQWRKKIEGLYDPENGNQDKYAKLKLKMCRQLVDWLLLIMHEGEHSLSQLSQLRAANSERRRLLVPRTRLFGPTNADQERQIKKAADTRCYFCLSRWKQIHQTCRIAIKRIEAECPGAYLSREASHTLDTLNRPISYYLGQPEIE